MRTYRSLTQVKLGRSPAIENIEMPAGSSATIYLARSAKFPSSMWDQRPLRPSSHLESCVILLPNLFQSRTTSSKTIAFRSSSQDTNVLLQIQASFTVITTVGTNRSDHKRTDLLGNSTLPSHFKANLVLVSSFKWFPSNINFDNTDISPTEQASHHHTNTAGWPVHH